MSATRISMDWTVETLLRRHPATARVFVRRRMACVGCSMARFDTIAESAANYGVEAQELRAELERVAAATEKEVDR